MVVKTDDDQWSQSPPCQCGGRGTSVRGAGRHLASSHSPGFVIRSYRYELSFPHLVVPEIHLADDLLLGGGTRLRQSPLHTEESGQLPRWSVIMMSMINNHWLYIIQPSIKGIISWSPNSTVLHLDIYLCKYTNTQQGNLLGYRGEVQYKTSQELRMQSSVTLNCKVTKIVMNSVFQLSEL